MSWENHIKIVPWKSFLKPLYEPWSLVCTRSCFSDSGVEHAHDIVSRLVVVLGREEMVCVSPWYRWHRISSVGLYPYSTPHLTSRNPSPPPMHSTTTHNPSSHRFLSTLTTTNALSLTVVFPLSWLMRFIRRFPEQEEHPDREPRELVSGRQKQNSKYRTV